MAGATAGAKAHRACGGVEPGSLAAGAGVGRQVVDFDLGETLLAAAVVVITHRIVQRLALLFAQAHAGAHAVAAPAVLAVVREQTRVELGVAGAANRTGALGREALQGSDVGRRTALQHGGAQVAQATEHLHHALAVHQRAGERLAQSRLVVRPQVQARHRQLDAVLLEAVDTREAGGRQKVAVDAQVAKAAWTGPVGKLGVDALAVDHQRREQADVLAAEAGEQLRGDAVGRLRCHRHAVVHTVLHAELHEQQAQEVPDLRRGSDGGLSAAARQPLLDRDGRRNAVDRVDLGTPCRLHDASGIGVERLQITALALVEKNVKSQRRLARTAHAGDDIELAARYVHAQRLEVVLLGVDDPDGIRVGVGVRWCSGVRRGPVARALVRTGLRAAVQGARLLRAVRAKTDCTVVLAQRACGVRCRVLAQLVRASAGDQLPAAFAAFGAKVDQPVAGADHVEVVLDDQQRVADVEQPAQRAHQLGDVVEMQAGGRLVEHEQRSAPGHRLAACAGALRRFSQKTSELESLRLAARQRRHRLTQLDVFQADINDRLQRADHVAVGAEQLRRLVHRQVQHLGHIQAAQLAPGSVGSAPRRGQPAVDTHLQNFGPVALAVAVGAAQVDVAEKLHLHMLEARTTAGGAAAVAPVETELGRGVAALARQLRVGEYFADRVPSAHIADRVRPCRLSDRRLVDEHHIAQQFGAEQALETARRIGGSTEVAQQRRCQHVLNQRRLARAAHAGDAYQPLQRYLDRDAPEVVLVRALEHQPRRVGRHQARKAHADLLAPAEVGAGQRIGVAQVLRAAVEDDLTAALPRPRPHVDHPVGRQHHGRIVLDHHQRVAGVAQPLHRLDDAMHIARMQSYAGLVEHKQRVHQRGAERRRQVDALHLAARQRPALAVQAEVTDADVAQVAQPGGDFVKQQLERLALAAGLRLRAGRTRAQAVEETPQPIDRQQHQVVQTQTRQGLELLATPLHAQRQEALCGLHHRVCILLAADSPQQALGLEPGAGAGRARRVAAVLRQQHPDVHLVRLGLQVFEEALDAKPVLVPFAVPIRRTVDNPLLLLGAELVPGRIARNAGVFGVAHQVVLALLPGGRLHRLDRTRAQRDLVVRNHQAVVDADDAAKAATAFAGADRRVERKRRRDRVGIASVAVRTMQPGGELPDLRLGLAGSVERIDADAPAAAPQRSLDRFDDAHPLGATQPEAVGHHIEQLAPARHIVAAPGFTGALLATGYGSLGRRRHVHLALGLHFRIAADRQPLRDLVGAGVRR